MLLRNFFLSDPVHFHLQVFHCIDILAAPHLGLGHAVVEVGLKLQVDQQLVQATQVALHVKEPVVARVSGIILLQQGNEEGLSETVRYDLLLITSS